MLQFSWNRLDDLFDDNGNYYRKMKTRVKQFVPNHVDEIRLNHLDSYDMFEHSSTSRFNFKNVIIKKIDRYVEARKNQVMIGYDFCKELHEENAKDEFLLKHLLLLQMNSLPMQKSHYQ